MSLLVKLDRLAIGSILRSKLVFLISVRSRVVFSFTAGEDTGAANILPSGVDIDNESNQVP